MLMAGEPKASLCPDEQLGRLSMLWYAYLNSSDGKSVVENV